jgi:hypothetical protein
MTLRDPQGHLVNILSRANQSSARR